MRCCVVLCACLYVRVVYDVRVVLCAVGVRGLLCPVLFFSLVVEAYVFVLFGVVRV